MKRLIALLVVLLAIFAAGFSDGGDRAYGSIDSNYGGWEAQGAIMCNQSHNGWITWQSDGYTLQRFVCGFAYDPGIGYYAPGWGYINSCPTGSPYYGYCWRWQD